MNAVLTQTTGETFPSWMTPPETIDTRLRHTLPTAMQAAKRWLVHKGKQPFYPDCSPRSGELDSPADTARLGAFEEALRANALGGFDGVGFALGAGWQGIDLDKVEVNGLTELVDDLPGYVERSPSGKGFHAIGYGVPFETIAPNRSGVEAYCGKRYFTVTGDQGHGAIGCIADFVTQRLVPLHRVSDGNKSASGAGGGAIIEGNRNATLASMAGTMRNLGMGQDAIESALLAENGSRCKPPLPTGEVQRIAKSVSRYTPTKDAALNDASGMFDAVSDEVIDWPDPLPIPNLPPVPAFDLDLLPSSIRPWVADVADRLQVPADMPAVAAVVALASAIGRRVQIRPKRNDRWTVPPNIWGMVIAPPGWKKSPALSAMMAPLHKLERDASHDHDAAMAAWLIDKERNAVVNSAAKSVGLKKLKNDPTAEVTGLTPDPDEPVPLRYVVNNFSLEALGEVMIGNPNGVLAFGDELYGLLKMADKPGNEELHSFLLTAWNGNDGFNFDRIGRGRRYVEYVCVSILGGIQPGRLQEYLTDGGTGGAIGSGFLNRFQMMTWPDLPTTYTYTDRVPNTEAEESYQIVFDRVARVSKFPDITGDLAEGPDVRQFDDEAQSVFDAWAEANDRLCRSDTLPPVLTSHLSKFGSLVASLALIFAVADEVKGVIPARYVHQAIGWSGYLRAQAERVFACTTRPDTVHARALLAKIKECVISDGFTARDVYRNEWSLLHRDGVEKATALLCDLDHLLRVDQLSAGRGRPPGAIYRINPKSKV